MSTQKGILIVTSQAEGLFYVLFRPRIFTDDRDVLSVKICVHPWLVNAGVSEMSLLSELYVSSVADAPKYDDSPEPFAPHCAEYQGLTYEEFANLWAVMCDRVPAESDADAFDVLLNVDEGERLINRFPDDFVARLAALNEQELEAVAEKWVRHGELSFLECSPGDVIPIIESLRRLATVAVTEQKLLCLWMCV